MGFKKIVLILAIIIALLSYWLYAPLPPGYSTESRRTYQIMIVATKMAEASAMVGSSLGLGTYGELFRDIMNKLIKDYGPHEVGGTTTLDTVFDGVPVRIYRPVGSERETLPGIVFYHGGGFVFGSIDTVDFITRRLCKETRSVVVSVEYRLAPKYTFPAAVDDCLKATTHFLSNAAEFNVDARRIATCGDSAGGNLATVVPIRLRDERFPIPVKFQLLIYPWVQSLDFDLPSMIQNRHGPMLTRDMMPFFAATYTEGYENHLPAYVANRHVTRSVREKISKTFLNLEKLPKEFLEGYERPPYPEGDEKLWGEIKDRLLSPYHSPLTADNLENLPEAYVLTANYDPLRDEGYLYALRLREASNKVTLYNAEIGFHGLVNFLGILPEADQVFDELIKFVRERL